MPSALLSRPFMSQAALESCRDEALVKSMLAFELALAEAHEQHGHMPDGTSQRMREVLEAHEFDVERIAAGVASGGNAAIPFVKQARATLPEELRRYWHLGATSQDVIDSALMHLLTPRLARIDELLLRCRESAIALMRCHSKTPMVGRTLMQQALPMAFGVKVAQWAMGLESARRRLAALSTAGLPVQFGGAVGVHSGWGEQGLALMDDVAQRMGLATPVLPWHTDRQPVHALATAVDAIAGAADGLALDIALLTQTEVGEVSEPSAPGMGESSSMPHKRNPVRCARIRTAARRIHGHTGVIINAMAQPLERGLGEWHAEWAPLSEMVLLLEGALELSAELLEGLEVFPERMRANLAITGGAIMAEPVAGLLAPQLGVDKARMLASLASEQARQSSEAYSQVLERLLAEQYPDVAGRVSLAELEKASDPALYLGSSEAQVKRAVEWLDSF
ncbi:class-II fumarase/aspartase family protein [Halomonas huangheensis]|uniref:Adenylosuccinate lyase C-terminal domain-containing protein n=1 Tax=Halomonas huangheensis TaxID=1178482 RepID=W1N9E5_9GAMM|nr:adenylosuccinate lyase family protein [Halomonas huangheensis]ALM53912.1 3-carboxy-cis,cis-muconate cycloisomerase [Halomonas huangheensis]ERL52138.1 hypothetical protein BJB45_09235 [Halomonas huangheensis]